jgi:hypothetical protein
LELSQIQDPNIGLPPLIFANETDPDVRWVLTGGKDERHAAYRNRQKS